jgi:hypothetical protein
MNLEYVPLVPVMRELQGLPRDRERFRTYLRTIFPRDTEADQLLPLLAMNPMGKDHVTRLLDALLALDADGIAARATAEAAAELADVPGDFKVGLVISDDLLGGWTNRYANEFTYRFGDEHGRSSQPEPGRRPRWLKDYWLMGVLWSSEPPAAATVRETILMSAHRLAYLHRHGPARNLRDMLAQEGHVMARAGCTAPVLDTDEIAYTREVLAPHLAATDKRACMELLFGDEGGRTLGFTPRGLSPWAGIALALHDARALLGSTRTA